jgi:hypothetical protein
LTNVGDSALFSTELPKAGHLGRIPTILLVEYGPQYVVFRVRDRIIASGARSETELGNLRFYQSSSFSCNSSFRAYSGDAEFIEDLG